MRDSIAQARCGLLPPCRTCAKRCFEERFNRSSAMWPTSTGASRRCPGMPLLFQSLKRDVAYFHYTTRSLPGGETMFQSLKRDVAYFHDLRGRDGAGLHTCFNRSSAMWPTSTHSNRLIVSFLLSVSIAQARCGLLPLFTTDKER